MQTASSSLERACKRRRVHTCTIWRSTSMSAPFSASSVNAIVAVVIVDHSSDYRLVGSHLNLIREPRWPPLPGSAVAARQAASGYALRALPRRRTYTTSWDINPFAALTSFAHPCVRAPLGSGGSSENRGRSDGPTPFAALTSFAHPCVRAPLGSGGSSENRGRSDGPTPFAALTSFAHPCVRAPLTR